MEKPIEERVTILETWRKGDRQDIDELQEEVKKMATKSDVADLKQFFETRDQQFTKNMWKVIFGLLILLAALVVSMFGIQNLPKLF
jgi:hypothetical protein